MPLTESLVQEHLDTNVYDSKNLSTPVKQLPPSFGYGNSSSPAYESPPTVGKSMRGNTLNWSTEPFGGDDSYFKQTSAHLLPSQFPPVRYESLESSPPEASHVVHTDELREEYDASPLRKKRGRPQTKHFMETGSGLIGGSTYMDPTPGLCLPEKNEPPTDSFVLKRVTKQRGPRKSSTRSSSYQEPGLDQLKNARPQQDSQFHPEYNKPLHDYQQHSGPLQHQQKHQLKHKQQHQPRQLKRTYMDISQQDDDSSDKIYRPIPIRRQSSVLSISRLSPHSDSYSPLPARNDSTTMMQPLNSPPDSASQISSSISPIPLDCTASSSHESLTAVSGLPLGQAVTLYTEKNARKPPTLFSSKVFQLACENQKSLNDPNTEIFKGVLEPFEPSKRQFTRKGAALKFSINHRGYVSIDATTPIKNSDSVQQSYNNMVLFENHSPNSESDLPSDYSENSVSGSGYSVAQSLLGDDSDSDSEDDYFPNLLETPPRFSSLGNTDATTAFARTLARARDGKDSTFLFPAETTPDKCGQFSSYIPSTPRTPLTFDEVNFNTQMQTPPGALYNFDSMNDIYGTGMTPYFNGVS